MFKRQSVLALVLAASFLAGCAGPRVLGSTEIELTSATSLPEPADRGGLFRIGPADRISVQITGLPELSRSGIVVDGQGFVTLPLVGAVQLGGLTIEQASRLVDARLRASYVRNPVSAVNFEESNSSTVTVDGQVQRPGIYPVSPSTTLLRAVAAAQGAGEFARLEEVVVLRTVEGRRYIAAYNLGAIRNGIYPDPRLFPDDVVVVGDSPSRRLFRDIIQSAPLITTPIIALIR